MAFVVGWAAGRKIERMISILVNLITAGRVFILFFYRNDSKPRFVTVFINVKSYYAPPSRRYTPVGVRHDVKALFY